MKSKSIRMKRILAFLIDYAVLFLPCILLTTIAVLTFGDIISIIIACTAIVTFVICFVLRDYLFNGRSIGKRICKLTVLDANTLSTPSAKQLIVKGVLLLFPLDCFFLIFSGKSLGERASCTIVMRKPQLPCADYQYSNCNKQGTPTKKRILVTVTVALAIALVMFLIVSAALRAVMKQENYRIAYDYLVNSDAFSEMHANESDISLAGYSSKILYEEDSTSTVVTFTFRVQGRTYEVVCHRDGDMWYVCEDCTNFH